MVNVARAAVLPMLLLVAAGGCQSRSSATEPPPEERRAPAPAPSAAPVPLPVAPAIVSGSLNPQGLPPYAGPIGVVRGIVRASGAPPAERPEVLEKIPAGKCDDARAFYGRTYREGAGRELGDVLVAITDYEGYLPPPEGPRVVQARGCAFESRTIALTFGQTLQVKNRGGETFIPKLVGARQVALVVAMPGGDPVTLFPDHPGQFELVDQTHQFATADVFVLKFPTFAVTGLDGKFEIDRIPAGEVTVSALLPATQQRVSQRVKVVAGETATVELTLPGAPQKVP